MRQNSLNILVYKTCKILAWFFGLVLLLVIGFALLVFMVPPYYGGWDTLPFQFGSLTYFAILILWWFKIWFRRKK